MFLEDVLALKDRYPDAILAWHFVMSREPQDVELFNGRIDAAKIRELAAPRPRRAPRSTNSSSAARARWSTDVTGALRGLGATGQVHVEHFTPMSGRPPRRR